MVEFQPISSPLFQTMQHFFVWKRMWINAGFSTTKDSFPRDCVILRKTEKQTVFQGQQSNYFASGGFMELIEIFTFACHWCLPMLLHILTQPSKNIHEFLCCFFLSSDSCINWYAVQIGAAQQAVNTIWYNYL